MAKRVVAEFYSFDPATRTITIPNRVITQNKLLLVTNTKTNTVLFNFSDPDLGITSYICPFSSTGTRFTLSYNTESMSSSDAILILEDKPAQDIAFDETVQDSVNKLRVATPESLIDTDFEYGLQPIKWESLSLINNIPGFYYKSGGNALNVTSISTGAQSPYSVLTIDCAEDHQLALGDVVNISYSKVPEANGTFLVQTIPTIRRFTVSANGVIASTPYNSSIVIQGGGTFDSNNQETRIIHSTVVSDNASPDSMITITTTGKHGLFPGAPILVSGATTLSLNGNWTVYDVPTTTSFRYLTPSIQTGTASPTAGNMKVFVRPEANFTHRPSDGGVLITTNKPQTNVTAIRQTRKYFRYQSGKGIGMSTGTKFTPTFDVNSISASGTSVTMVTQQTLTFTSGSTVQIEGVEVNAGSTNPYNGTFLVDSVNYATHTFTYYTSSTSTDVAPAGDPQVTCTKWDGALVRMGMFDNQNGFFFEYDGDQVFCVQRRSTSELMGTFAATNQSTTITGTGSKLSKQVRVGDNIVIRGQSHLVVAVDSDTSMEISPMYRGISITGIRINKTEDIRVPQTDWNLDKCDANGPSGYLLDTARMQMFYIDYSWYGAGKIRYGMRMTDGGILFCHVIANNNIRNQAYMRSGNLPARYEVNNIGPTSVLYSGDVNSAGQDLESGDSTLVIKDGFYWPDSGNIILQQGTQCEVMSYSGKAYNSTLDAYNLTGLTRRLLGGDTSNLTFTATEFDGGTAGASSQCSISYITCTCAPIISHWGTSVIMDGGYTEDRSIVYTVSNGRQKSGKWSGSFSSFRSASGYNSCNLIAIRLAPSVDNSVVGALGQREIVNRMQLKLKSIGAVTGSSGNLLLTGILNPKVITGVPLPTIWALSSITATVGSGSLAQYIDFTSNTQTCAGGEEIFSFLLAQGTNTYELDAVRELGNSIVGGDGSNATPGFPVGPDVLVICLNNYGASTTGITQCRISWTEAQA